jgi:HlyD family secretion protein
MKRLTRMLGVLLAVALVVAAGYLGFRGATGEPGLDMVSELEGLLSAVGLRGRPARASAVPEAPPTVPVSRGDVRQTVIAPGQLVGTRATVLSTDVGGHLAQILVRPGDVVRAGEVLARMDQPPLEQALAEARLRLEQAEAEQASRLDEAELAVKTARLRLEQAAAEHPRQLREGELALVAAESRLAEARFQYPDLTAAEIRLQNAVRTLRDAEQEYKEALERLQAGWEPEMVSQGYLRTLERARDERAIAEAEYNRARASQAAASQQLQNLQTEVERAALALERLQAGVDPLLRLELQRAQEELGDLQRAGVDPFLALAVEKAQADLDATVLVAPFDGVVVEITAREGETIPPGTGLILLVDPMAVEVRVTVIEEDLPLVEIGQPVELFFDALLEASVEGRVTRILPQRVPREDRPLYEVYIAPEALPPGLALGMTADASIIVAQRADVLQLPRALVRTGSTGTAQVEVWTDGQAQERTIRVGLRGDVFVEILDGLREGEQVVGQ